MSNNKTLDLNKYRQQLYYDQDITRRGRKPLYKTHMQCGTNMSSSLIDIINGINKLNAIMNELKDEKEKT